MKISRQRRIFENLVVRQRVMDAVRRFFRRHGFLEVQTPVRIPAPAPEAHIEAVSADGAYLHTSPEIYMKRLLAAGYPRVFQLCKTFRKNERGRRHLPEFTMLEWYAAGVTYREMMEQTCDLVCSVCADVLGGDRLFYQGQQVDLSPPWPRMTVEEAFRRYAGITVHDALAGDRFDTCMGLDIEAGLDRGRPVFLCDYPVERGALARRRPDNPRLAERFEAYVGGLELCNGFTELTDAGEQRRRFEAELERRARRSLAVYPMPEPFLRCLPHMPPAAGNALGIDRLVMLMVDAAEIDDVVAFVPEEY